MTEGALTHKVASLANRLGVDPPSVRIAGNGLRNALEVRYAGATLRVSQRAMEELTDSEIEFGLALSFAKRMRPDYETLGIAAVIFLIFFGFGIALLLMGRLVFVDQFLLGFGMLVSVVLAGYMVAGYVVALVGRKYHADVYHEALLLTGNASAAETYLIRSQTEHILGSRRRMSQREKEALDRDLGALREAATKLGIAHRRVVPKFD